MSFTMLNSQNSYYIGHTVSCDDVTEFCFYETDNGVCQMFNENGKPLTRTEYEAMKATIAEKAKKRDAYEVALKKRQIALGTINQFDRRERCYFAVKIHWSNYNDNYKDVIKKLSEASFIKIHGAKGKVRKSYSLVISCSKTKREWLLSYFSHSKELDVLNYIEI